MRNRLLGLRHHAVVGRYHQNHDIGRLGATGSHCGKRFMTRRIQEGNNAARRFHMICADMLCNAARFTGCHFRTANIVEQRSFAVVNVTHYGDNWCTRQRLEISVFRSFFEHCFWIVELGCMRHMAHLFDQNHCCFLIEHLVDRNHLTELHQMLDDFGCFHRHLVG